MTLNRRSWLLPVGMLACTATLAKLLLHFYAARRYGYFIDELYYLDCAEHLGWGYVDQPPLIALIARIVRETLGSSLTAIHLLPAIAGAGKVLVTAALTRELGGRRFAQGLAALCVLLAPGFLALDNWLSMNAFEPLFWMGCAWLVIRIIKTRDSKLWLWFGLLAGIGLENKYTMLVFGFAIVGGLLATPERRILRTRWLWAGGPLAFLIFLPNLLWNIQHRFPFLELQRNLQHSGRNVDLTPLSFLLQEVLMMLPVAAPVWLAGAWFFLLHRDGKPFRALGWAFVITATLILTLNPRVYYLFPAFPMLFAAGAVLLESWFNHPRLRWIKYAYAAVLITAGVVIAPMAVPVLPVETYMRYANALNLQQPRVETHPLGPLPQLYADQFGWEEMTAEVARVYRRLPAEIRAQTAIFAQNYGQAGAIDFFGPKFGLPRAISGHQTYFLWGPREYTGDSMIVLHDRQENLEELFAHVEVAGHVGHPYSMPEEHFAIFYCRGMKRTLKDSWAGVKNWR